MEIYCKTQVYLLFCVHLETRLFFPLYSAESLSNPNLYLGQKGLSWMHKARIETTGLTAAKCSVAYLEEFASSSF